MFKCSNLTIPCQDIILNQYLHYPRVECRWSHNIPRGTQSQQKILSNKVWYNILNAAQTIFTQINTCCSQRWAHYRYWCHNIETIETKWKWYQGCQLRWAATKKILLVTTRRNVLRISQLRIWIYQKLAPWMWKCINWAEIWDNVFGRNTGA
jgi:hypothetical protein